MDLIINATGTAFDNLDDLSEDLERDLRLSCEPTEPLWLVTAHLPDSTFGFEWGRDAKAGGEAFVATIERGLPGTRVVLKWITVPASIAASDADTITEWIDSHEDDFEAYDVLLAAVID